MPARDSPEVEVEPDGPVTLICFMCLNRLHSKCRALTAERWCECGGCGWIYPDGQPPTFWRI